MPNIRKTIEFNKGVNDPDYAPLIGFFARPVLAVGDLYNRFKFHECS